MEYPEKIHEEEIILTQTPDELFVGLNKNFDQLEFLRTNSFELLAFIEPPVHYLGFTSQSFAWIKMSQSELLDKKVDFLMDHKEMHFIHPVYFREDLLPKKTGFSFLNSILIVTDSSVPINTIKDIKRELKVDVSDPIKLNDTFSAYKIIVNNIGKNFNILDFANNLKNNYAFIKTASLNWMSLYPILHTIPNDPFFNDQWALSKIGAVNAWKTTSGSSQIVVAVIDTGADLNHEDMIGNYVQDSDRFNAIDSSNNPSDSDGHGTLISGLISAKGNNGIGIAGLTWDCKIMPIKIVESVLRGGGELDVLLRAVEWAIDHDSQVINMSWEWEARNTDLEMLFERAYAKNIVLVSSAGNYYRGTAEPAKPLVDYPASYHRVIAVGAADGQDLRKTFQSKDGQCWGSNYGNELSVLAPGILLLSTDVSGTNGWNNQLGGTIAKILCINSSLGPHDDYCTIMGGTSGAAALVSGLVALLLSYHPRLSNNQVRDIIEQSAEKINGYTYNIEGGYNNGSWNIETGYGRINAHRALELAKKHGIQ
jgi:subtilisin family serine protease